MSEEHIRITDRIAVSNLQLILEAIAAVIVSLLGVDFVPGFFFTTLVDYITPLRTGLIWLITLLTSLLLIGQ